MNNPNKLAKLQCRHGLAFNERSNYTVHHPELGRLTYEGWVIDLWLHDELTDEMLCKPLDEATLIN